MNTKKKSSVVKKGDNPALGNFVRYYVQQNNIKMKTLSEGLGISYNSLNSCLKNSSFQFTILWRMSKIVNYNFLMDLGQWLNIPFETNKEKELLNQLAQKDEEIKNLTTQLGVYKEIVKS